VALCDAFISHDATTTQRFFDPFPLWGSGVV